MEKNLVYSELLSIYKGLLTPKQAEAMEYYYDQDYSLGEISELMDISRQGVRDFIKRAEMIMDENESKLHLAEKFRAVENIRTANGEICEINKQIYKSSKIEEFTKIIVKNLEILENGVE